MKIEVGVTVKVLADNYGGRFKDKVGTVERLYDYGKVGVKINGCKNKSSSYGVYWFNTEDVEIYEREEEYIMFNNFKVAVINFISGSNTGTPYFYALYDDSIKEGDMVVVQTGHHGLGIAKVIEIDPPVRKGSVKYNREIISRIDLSAFEERKAKREKMLKLKEQMDAKVKELQNQAIYELLAEKDPVLKQMLDEYKELMV